MGRGKYFNEYRHNNFDKKESSDRRQRRREQKRIVSKLRVKNQAWNWLVKNGKYSTAHRIYERYYWQALNTSQTFDQYLIGEEKVDEDLMNAKANSRDVAIDSLLS